MLKRLSQQRKVHSSDSCNSMLLVLCQLMTAMDQCQPSLLHTCRHNVLGVVTLQVFLSICNSQVVYCYCVHAQCCAVYSDRHLIGSFFPLYVSTHSAEIMHNVVNVTTGHFQAAKSLYKCSYSYTNGMPIIENSGLAL